MGFAKLIDPQNKWIVENKSPNKYLIQLKGFFYAG